MYFCCRQRLSCSCRSNAEVEVLSELLKGETHSDHMVSADGRDAQSSDGTWMPPVLSTGRVSRDALDDHGIWMTPTRSIVTVPRCARDLDGISPASLQLLLRESAAPAFMGEGSSLCPKPTRTNIHAHPRHSELEPRRGHVEQGPHRSNERSRRRSRIAAHLCPTLHRQGRIGPGVLGQSVRAKELMVDHQALIIEDCLCLPSVKVGNVRMI